MWVVATISMICSSAPHHSFCSISFALHSSSSMTQYLYSGKALDQCTCLLGVTCWNVMAGSKISVQLFICSYQLDIDVFGGRISGSGETKWTQALNALANTHGGHGPMAVYFHLITVRQNIGTFRQLKILLVTWILFAMSQHSQMTSWRSHINKMYFKWHNTMGIHVVLENDLTYSQWVMRLWLDHWQQAKIASVQLHASSLNG
jgi:hypothetical protein